jgi:hypothetical protein
MEEIESVFSFFKNMFNFKRGENVHMTLLEMALYGGVPMVGQLMLRADKLGGSLDKPWLLFPLFFIPPFSFIPVIMAYFGLIKNTNAGKPYDYFMWIPIIFRFILIFVLTALGNPGGILLKTALILGALFVTNILHVMNEPLCKDNPFNFFNSAIKESADSMVLYSSGVLANFIVLFIPFIGEIIGGIEEFQVPFLADIVDTLIWSGGMISGYILVNMVDANFGGATAICQGKIDNIRTIVSIIAVAISIFYQFKNLIL